MSENDSLLTASEVCAFLKQSRASVYRHVASGALPALRVGGAGPLRFRPDEVEQLLERAGPAREEAGS